MGFSSFLLFAVCALCVLTVPVGAFRCADAALKLNGKATGYQLCEEIQLSSQKAGSTTFTENDTLPNAGGIAQFSFRHVQRSFYNVSGDQKHKVSGHLVTLHSDISKHLTILQPSSGCGNGKGSPVRHTARQFERHRVFRHWVGCTAHTPSQFCQHAKLAQARISRQHVYITSSSYGCRLASNAGLFDTDTFACLGTLVQDGEVVQERPANTAQFGIIRNKNSSSTYAVVGYLHKDDRLAHVEPLQWVSGLGWLVRDGKDFASTGIPLAFEDSKFQETGTLHRFFNVGSGRTVVGLDKNGRLMIAQIDGRTDWLGVDLYTLSRWAVELGFQNAINLDGGGSSTFVRDGHVVNTPSYSCVLPDSVWEEANDEPTEEHGTGQPADRGLKERDRVPVPEDPNLRCQRSVSSILCIHDEPSQVDIHKDDGCIVLQHGCVCHHPAEFSVQEVAELLCFHEGVAPQYRRLEKEPGQTFRGQFFRRTAALGQSCLCNGLPSQGANSYARPRNASVSLADPMDSLEPLILHLSRDLPGRQSALHSMTFEFDGFDVNLCRTVSSGDARCEVVESAPPTREASVWEGSVSLKLHWQSMLAAICVLGGLLVTILRP